MAKLILIYALCIAWIVVMAKVMLRDRITPLQGALLAAIPCAVMGIMENDRRKTIRRGDDDLC